MKGRHDETLCIIQDLRADQEIVYGLIDQPNFFDLIYHQLFYFQAIQSKVAGPHSWTDKIAVWLKGKFSPRKYYLL